MRKTGSLKSHSEVVDAISSTADISVAAQLIESIVQRAKESALKRAIQNPEKESGISRADLLDALAAEYRESEIFPPTEATEDWLKLLDYDPANVVKVTPIKPEKQERRKTSGSRVI